MNLQKVSIGMHQRMLNSCKPNALRCLHFLNIGYRSCFLQAKYKNYDEEQDPHHLP
jgi:hypothetical protein